MNRRNVLAAAVLLVSMTGLCTAAEPLEAAKWAGTGPATVEAQAGGAVLKIDDPFQDAGITITPAEGQTFDLSAYRVLAVDVENLSADRQTRIVFSLSSGGPDRKSHKEQSFGAALNPGEKRTLRYLLPHTWKYGAPEGFPGVRTIDTAKVNPIRVIVQWPFEPKQAGLVDLKITNLRGEEPLQPTGAASAFTAENYAPFIDEFGQYLHGDWQAKIHSSSDLVASKKAEDAELAKTPRPADWDRFGGWKDGPTLKATGNFRTEKYEGKWYLVDPDGKLFISQGIDVLSPKADQLKVMPGKENWFQTLPEGAKTYDATTHCLALKYGTDDFDSAYYTELQKRLEAWGINSLGDWSRAELMAIGKTPYTLQLTDYENKLPKLQSTKRKFYDVFDPIYVDRMKRLVSIAAQKNPMVEKSLTDPMCIGYFIDNELDFGNRGRLTLVDDVIKCPADQASKKELLGDLKTKYGSVAKLNEAWGTQLKDWDAFLQSTDVPTTDAYKADSKVFFEKTLDQYFRLARDAVKSAAPNRLYLGCRFISTDAVRPALFNASAKYADVLSVNIYAFSAANFPSHETPGFNFPDIPVLIGEFHFGVPDRGSFSTGLCNAGLNQTDRALAYTRFMEGVLSHPNIVGAHWFQFRDQPLTGRGDGEAYPIGFVDATDTPYPEMGAAARQVAEKMYQIRTKTVAGNATAQRNNFDASKAN